MRGAVDIGQEAIAQFEIFAADGLALGAELPRLAQLGLIPVRPAQRAKRAELEPSNIQLGGAGAAETKTSDV